MPQFVAQILSLDGDVLLSKGRVDTPRRAPRGGRNALAQSRD
jgi:hypothetical protein